MFREKFLALSRYSSKEDKMLKLNMKFRKQRMKHKAEKLVGIKMEMRENHEH